MDRVYASRALGVYWWSESVFLEWTDADARILKFQPRNLLGSLGSLIG
jgi:hypothetical protein